MNHLISICLIFILAVPIGRAQDSNASTSDDTPASANQQPSPYRPAEPQPLRPLEPKRITIFPTGDAQESEVAMKFVAYLEKEGFATGKVTELTLTPDAPLQVHLIMHHEESHEKIKRFLTSLGDAGVERIFFETDENVHGGDEKNGLSFRAIPGYSPDDVERIENAAVSAAESCGLALCLGGTYVKSWKPTGESATLPSLRPVEPKRIALFADVDEEPSEMVTRFLTDLESDGIANVEAKGIAPAFRYPIQLNFVPKEDEPLEKIKQFIVALRQSGVEQINCDLRGHHGGQNTLLFTAIPGYSHEEQQWIENAARTAAEHCGLSITLTGTMVFPSNVNARKIAQRRTDYEATNKQAHDLAESLSQTPDAVKKAELRIAVQRAFTLRQSLLRAELQEMQARLEKTQQSLDMRDRMADQIVDRRVEDLLNPQLKWEGGTAPGQPLTQSVSPNSPAIPLPAAADPKSEVLAKLQGTWDLDLSDQDGGFPGARAEVTIEGNLLKLWEIVPPQPGLTTETLRTEAGTMLLEPGAVGPPQQIDVVIGPNDGEKRRATQGIIEITGDTVMLCYDSQEPKGKIQRPIAFAQGKHSDLLVLKRRNLTAIVSELEGDWHLGTPVDPKAGLLAKLQGQWDMHIIEADPNPPGGQEEAVIEGNLMTITITLDGKTITTPVQLKLDRSPETYAATMDGKPIVLRRQPASWSSDLPQRIDLIMSPNDNNERSELKGIIEFGEDTVRICYANSSQSPRPEVFAVGKDADIWELRRKSVVTELEGDWHCISITDPAGQSLDHPKKNVTVRGHKWYSLPEHNPRNIQIHDESGQKTIDFEKHTTYAYWFHRNNLKLSGHGMVMEFARGHNTALEGAPLLDGGGDWTELNWKAHRQP